MIKIIEEIEEEIRINLKINVSGVSNDILFSAYKGTLKGNYKKEKQAFNYLEIEFNPKINISIINNIINKIQTKFDFYILNISTQKRENNIHYNFIRKRITLRTQKNIRKHKIETLLK